MRKKIAHEQQLLAVDRKNAADDDFFWGEVYRLSKRPDRKTSSKNVLFSKQGTAGIDFSKYEDIEVHRSGPDSSKVPVLHNFVMLQQILPSFLHLNLTATDRMAYSIPTPIQKHCIPLSLHGAYDVMACAQTGSGKTVAFLVPLITAIVEGLGGNSTGNSDERKNYRNINTPATPSALVVAPTRELASQIELECQKLLYSSTLQTCVCYGGVPQRPQLSALAGGVDILVGTPGRLQDFLSRGLISLRKLRFLVLDEADRMLDMGFEPQIRSLCDDFDMPHQTSRRTLMFSATFPEAMQNIATNYMTLRFCSRWEGWEYYYSITQKLVS